MTEEQLRAEAKRLGYKLIRRREYERFLPCTCGCNRRSLWTGERGFFFECEKCGRKGPPARSESEAKRMWNEMIQGETVWKYGMRLRGYSPGCQPMKGLKGVTDGIGRYYNVLVYDRELTDEECQEYELTFLERLDSGRD